MWDVYFTVVLVTVVYIFSSLYILRTVPKINSSKFLILEPRLMQPCLKESLQGHPRI